MKLLFTLLITLCLSQSYAQEGQPKTATADTSEIYQFPDQTADFPGGAEALSKFLSDAISYPKGTLKKKDAGRVYMRFVVEKDGSVTNLEVYRSLATCPQCNKAALDGLQKMPKWKPAVDDGQVVRSYFIIPINFQP